MPKIISIANDFSIYPGGRTPEDGDFSGQDFRSRFLVPALTHKERIIVDFDGTRGYGSSFLEEAFGGLVRLGYTKEQIYFTITFQSSRQSIIDEVKEYIENATKKCVKK